MKVKRIIQIIFILSTIICFDSGPTFALEGEASAETSEQGTEETLSDVSAEELRFFAVNAGYKDSDAVSLQNYDFFALEKTDSGPLALAGYEVVYANSSGNAVGSVVFSEKQLLQNQMLIIGSSKSPQYSTAPSDYLFNFGSSGLASTGGKLSLLKDGEVIDEVCWGKLECAHQIPKFATGEDANYSVVLRDGEFVQEKYYPEIDEAAIETIELERDYCTALKITEIYSYYEESSSEQFIEIYNPVESCSLEGLSIGYKNKTYALHGQIKGREYLAVQNEDMILTKDPTSSNTIAIVGDDGDEIDSEEYKHGQKKGLSNVLMNGEWLLSYARTPGAENVYQEFQTCPEGKIINEETGNCINEEAETTTVCPEGKVLNPETGRCKKIEEESTLAECAEGYERNPETNRCRKIQDTDGSEYAPRTSASTSFSEPRRFIAYGALALAILAGVIYVAIQYREEIAKFFRALGAKLKRAIPSKRKTLAFD